MSCRDVMFGSLLLFLMLACDTSSSLSRSGTKANDTCESVDKSKQLAGRSPPAIEAAAEDVLPLPLGSGRVKLVDGKPYLFCVERHDNRPSKANAEGWHKGVTVYAQ